MLPSIPFLRDRLHQVIDSKAQQGHEVDGLAEELSALPASYDALAVFGGRLVDLPLRADWPWHEPDELAAIRSASDPARATTPIAPVDPVAVAPRIEAAFLGSVCGCQLGKPIEVNPTLADLRRAGELAGEWPVRYYISEVLLDELGRRHPSWIETVRERLHGAAADDDINYSIIGMLLLEEHGAGFGKDHLCTLWSESLPSRWCHGPERTFNIRAALHATGDREQDIDDWVRCWNPGDEFCGALIRADAYGYACPGDPERASGLAWRDASCTHRRTGIYATMYVAAAIAAALVLDDPLEVFRTAQRYVPQQSRFHAIVADSLDQVADADDWLEGYERIHRRYGEYSHCRVYQECGTLINTLRFADSVGDGICKQVMQGNDTDSFGATAGSLLGAFFGPGHLEERWTAPLHDELRCTVATFHERSLERVAARMARLPQLLDA